MKTSASLEQAIVACRRCPRLVAWREEVARVKRKAYREEPYWGRPVPGFGDPAARLVIVGLAPGAHGANRTGRAFTGDASGDFLYAALHRAGLASQATATSKDDGLTLRGAWITLACRCVPPDNLPSPAELGTCRPFLERELALLRARVVLALGKIAYDAVLGDARRDAPAFAHGAVATLDGATIFASYHVSRQNTQTGRLTAAMFDEVLARAKDASTTSRP